MPSRSIRPWLAAHRWQATATVVGAVVAVWMVVPAAQARGGVVLVADRVGSVAAPDTVSQLRQNGRAADVLVVADSSCELVEQTDFDELEDGTGFVVISVAESAECVPGAVAELVDRARAADLTPVVVRLPGVALGDVDAVVVDTEVLLGAPGVATRSCEWWDRVDPFGVEQDFACSADDLVVVRFDDGGLTPAGTQRVARMVAAAIG